MKQTAQLLLMTAVLALAAAAPSAQAQMTGTPAQPMPTSLPPPPMPWGVRSGNGGNSTPTPSAAAADAARAIRAGNWVAAEHNCRRALDLSPKMQRCWSMLGVALFNQRRYAEARPAFERAIALRTDDIVVLGELGATLALLKDRPAAQARLDDLTARKAACADRCRAGAQIDEAIANIELALSTVG